MRSTFRQLGGGLALTLWTLLLAAPASAQDDDEFDDYDFDEDEDEDEDVDVDVDQDEDDVDLDEYEDERQETDLRLPEEITEDDLKQAVLVVPMAGETSESTGVGVLLEGFLRGALEEEDRLTVLGLEEVPLIEDIDAALYYEGCPAGEELGCQFVIGEVAGVDRVVSGRVTVLAQDRYQVAVTILNVPHADLEYEYALKLGAGEEALLARSVVLALDMLRRAELLAPYEDALDADEARRLAMEEAETEEERRVVARMELGDVHEDDLTRAEEAARPVQERVTEEQVREIRESEGVVREWEDLGIREGQYLSYKNSGLEFDRWRWRWAGHRLQILASVNFGFIGGATGLRYYGGYLLDPQLAGAVDQYSWQVVDQGQSFTVGFSAGVGILRNLDIEVGAWWSRSHVNTRLFSGDTECPTPGDVDCQRSELVPSPTNHAPSGLVPSTVNLWGGEVMVRYFILTVPVVRPTVGAGISWILYPDLYNDPSIPDSEETPAVPDEYITFPRLVEFGVQLEPGVQVDIGKHLGIFLRVPIAIGLNPARRSLSGEYPPAIINNADEPIKSPFGTVRVVVGVQGRILGLPVQPRTRDDADVLDEDL